MAYQLTFLGAKRLADDTEFPFVDGNIDYEEYKAWLLEEGNEPLPAAVVDWRAAVWEEYRIHKDQYLGRLSEIAGRYARKGDTTIPPVADAIAEGLLAFPASTSFLAPSITNADELRAAIVFASNQLLKAQLTNPTTAPTIKAALDKVFK